MSEELLHTPNYRLTCLYCNGALYPVFFMPESAPWLCTICHHSWWATELSEQARKMFRPALCDFGINYDLVDTLHKAVFMERDNARARGTSVRTDQLQLLPLHILQRLPRPTMESFGEMIQLEITRKGG